MIEFWCGLGSPESYVGAERLRRLAADAGVAVRWRPFLVQPDDPAALEAAEAACTRSGLPFRRPSVFPRDGAPGARAALACDRLGLDAGAFVRAALDANFVRDWDIADPTVLGEILVEIDYDGARVLELARSAEVETRLETLAGEAQAKGWRGAPRLVSAGEAFDLRSLGRALDHAAAHKTT